MEYNKSWFCLPSVDFSPFVCAELFGADLASLVSSSSLALFIKLSSSSSLAEKSEKDPKNIEIGLKATVHPLSVHVKSNGELIGFDFTLINAVY